MCVSMDVGVCVCVSHENLLLPFAQALHPLAKAPFEASVVKQIR